MPKKLIGLLVDPYKHTIKETTIIDDGTCTSFYTLLDCDMVEMPERYIGNKLYNLVCDEEGLLKGNPVFATKNLGVSDTGKNILIIDEMIAGKVFITNFNDNGELESLSPSEITSITNFYETLKKHNYPYLITQVDPKLSLKNDPINNLDDLALKFSSLEIRDDYPLLAYLSDIHFHGSKANQNDEMEAE